MAEQVHSPAGKPGAGQKSVCFHCGDDCSGNGIEQYEKHFCCAGCLSVYCLISGNHLGAYYTLESCPGKRPIIEDSARRFGWLDDSATVERLLDVSIDGHCRVTLSIPHVHCSSCVWLLEKLYQMKEGINSSHLDLLRKELVVTFDNGRISLRNIVELLASLGYEPHIDLTCLDKSVRKVPFNSQYIKIGLAGFAFGNIMLFSFPEYLASQGLSDTIFGRVFGYSNLILSTPVLIYSARDFLISAWNGLKNKSVNIDLPIALGLLALFARSAVEVVFGLGAGYFDSFSGLVFFLLVGRLFQAKTYHALSFDRDYRSYLPIGVVRRIKIGEEVVAVDSLVSGDEIVIRNQELAPVDGVLVDGVGCIDYSFLTGESEPQFVRTGERIKAGGRQIGSAIAIAATKTVSSSFLARLWRADCFHKPRPSQVVAAANIAAKYFTVAVLVIAAATALFWWRVDSSMMLNAVTAVLMVACPCALAMASPYVFGTAMRLLGRNDIYLRSAETVELLAHTTHIVFDKTGTLTKAGWAEMGTPYLPHNDYFRTLVASLARQSIHPVSRHIWQTFGVPVLLPVTRFEEVTGKGTCGIVEGHLVRLGTYDWASRNGAIATNNTNGIAGAHVWFAIDNEVLEAIPISKGLRPGLKVVLSKLADKFELSLLSGDDNSSRREMSRVFGTGKQLFYRQSPQEKLEYVQCLQKRKACVVMVGDGLNDAGALRQADIGITIVEDTASFTPSSDTIMAAKSFEKLPAVMNFSKRSMRVLYLCFAISLVYNVVGLGFAVSGLLTPLVAAVLMPLSSVSVVLIAVLATRYQAVREGLA